jgi:hypothetical protein
MPTNRSAATSKAIGDGDIELVLAHPLPLDRARDIFGDEITEDLEIDQKIRVDRQRARQFINGGLVQTDPDNREEVRKVLKLDDVRQAQVPEGSVSG